jgi:hypothetical protein
MLAHHLSAVEGVVFELIVVFTLEDLYADVVLEHYCPSEI